EWTLYGPHRARLTEALLSIANPSAGRVCILGAGRCNDLDLERLAARYSEIHLVDVNAAAIRQAISRQMPAVRARVKKHGPLDLSGLSKRRLDKWKRRPPTASEITSAMNESLPWLLASLPGPFDVVASTCVLTQMAFALTNALGDAHPMLGAVRLALM